MGRGRAGFDMISLIEDRSATKFSAAKRLNFLILFKLWDSLVRILPFSFIFKFRSGFRQCMPISGALVRTLAPLDS